MKEKDKIGNMLEIPKEVYTNQPKIVVIGFDELVIENYKSILEYEDYYLKLETHIGIININGTGLSLDKMTEDNLKVTGKIEIIKFERRL